MKKFIGVSLLTALAMLLPVAGRVNASSPNPSLERQGGGPMPTGGSGGGHFTLRQGGGPMPTGGSGGGHFTLTQGGGPMPTGGSGGGH